MVLDPDLLRRWICVRLTPVRAIHKRPSVLLLILGWGSIWLSCLIDCLSWEWLYCRLELVAMFTIVWVWCVYKGCWEAGTCSIRRWHEIYIMAGDPLYVVYVDGGSLTLGTGMGLIPCLCSPKELWLSLSVLLNVKLSGGKIALCLWCCNSCL